MTTIVVGVDGSDTATNALRWALDEADRLGGATLRAVAAWHYPVVAVSPWVGGIDPLVDLREPTALRLDHSLEAAGAASHAGVRVEKEVVCESAARALIDAGQGADLLVVGTRGLGGFTGLLLGSISHQVATHAPCPVVIVPLVEDPAPAAATPAIVVGTDGSANGLEAVRFAAREAKLRKLPLRVVYVWHFPYAPVMPAPIGTAVPPFDAMQDAAVEALDGFLGQVDLSGLTVERVIAEGSASATLVNEAKGHVLLVVGARGHSAIGGLLLGSVASQTAHHTTTPLVIVPAQGASA